MWRMIGLMSGTSLDGVDAAWIETDGVRVARFGRRLTLPYPPQLRRALRTLLDRAPMLDPSAPDLAGTSATLTRLHAEAVARIGEAADAIGMHGQTILHQPQRGRTWQIGDARWLAARLHRPVVYDFRSADVAAGGEGAPLAPIFHAALAAGMPKPLAVLNLGGVANVTWIGKDGALMACDTGPGNGLLDDWVRAHTGHPFDEDGRLAAQGHPDAGVLARLLDDPYFARPCPKSLDRLAFSARVAGSGLADLSAADGAATLACFTARAAARAPLPEPPWRWLVAGGGRHNRAIMAALRDRLGDVVAPVEEVGWDGDALEAQCFGFLAARVLADLPLSFPGTTGVAHPQRGGRIALPNDAGGRDRERPRGSAL